MDTTLLRPYSPLFQRTAKTGLFLTTTCALFLQASPTMADDQPAKKPKHRNTPLDTVLQTRLWTDVPEAKDFVKEHRPETDKLNYQPTWGKLPERPKLRNESQLQDLDKELEAARGDAGKRGTVKPR